MSFLSLLTILFIGLKLAGFIAWSWWLVLLPFYGSFSLALAVILLWALVMGKKPTLKINGKKIW